MTNGIVRREYQCCLLGKYSLNVNRRYIALFERLFLIISISTFILIFADTKRPNHYTYLYVLPLLHSLILFILHCLKRKSFFAFIFETLFTIRNVFVPLIMRFGGYLGYFENLTTKNVVFGIFLMLFETGAVLFFSHYISKKHVFTFKKPEANTKRKKTFFVAIMALIVIISLKFIFPSYFESFSSIFDGTKIRSSVIVESSVTSSSVLTLISILLPVVYLSLSVYFINFINCLHIRNCFKVVGTFACVCIPFLFMGGNNGFTIICIVSLFLYSLLVCNFNKTVYVFIALIGLFMTGIYILLLIGKVANYSQTKYSVFESLSMTLQAYFPGVCNFAGVFNIGNHGYFKTLFYDLFTTIPFRTAIFGDSSDFRLVLYYTADNNAPSNIIPCIGQLFYYFSLFGIVFEFLLIKWSFSSIKKVGKCSHPLGSFTLILLSIYLLLTPLMYNYTILLSRVFLTIVPLTIVSKAMQLTTR